jgi:hypothetical protein
MQGLYPCFFSYSLLMPSIQIMFPCGTTGQNDENQVFSGPIIHLSGKHHNAALHETFRHG